MHPYATPESRVATYGALAVVSVVMAWLVVAATSHLSWPQWLISAPSVTAVFAALYALTDRWLWRTRFFRALRLSSTPDLSGSYVGELRSTFNDPAGSTVVRPLELTVTQTWTRIQISMTVGSGERTSRSRSVIACVGDAEPRTQLIYHYRNQINPAVADADMGDHDGAADLEVTADGHLSGRYFNSRPRAGSIEATRS